MRLELKSREAVNFGAGVFVKDTFTIDQYEITRESVTCGKELADELGKSIIYRIDRKEWKPVTVEYDHEAKEFRIQTNTMKVFSDAEAEAFLAELVKARKIAAKLNNTILIR